MVRSQPYACMTRPQAVLVGKALIRENAARVLVTIIDEQSLAHGFVFFMSRQTEPPFNNCWMTEGVQPTRQPAGNPASPAEPSPAA
jgi:hypothetical protein